MKKIFFVWMALIFSSVVLAGPVSQEEAKNKAQKFINGKRMQHVSGPRRVKLAHRQTTLVEAPQADALYYVFDVGANDGFVIISGDDRTPSVLGYTDEGTFDTQNMPDNMRAWLQGYADQLAWLQQHPDEQPVIQKVPTKNVVLPLIQSQWNQDEPYNLQCPKDPTTKKLSMTGCVATALAQVMYYYKWPTATSEAIPSYTTDTRGISVGTIPSGTSFDWDHMLDTYNNEEDNVYKNAVAKLMKVCGAAMLMDYASSQSGAYLDPEALITYFNYSKTIREISRQNFTLAEWNNLIYAELEEARPVLYSASSSGGGHQFVIDGYDGDELFHVNWGWGGHQDGYFLLSVLNPGSTAGIGASTSSDGYSFNQIALVGVKPSDGDDASGNVKLTSSIVSVSGNRITSSYRNLTSDTHSFDFGIGMIADDGTITPVGNTRVYNNVGVGWGYDESSFTVSGLPDGAYKIIPISKERGTEVWLPNVSVKKEYVEAVVNNGVITLTLHKPIVNLTASSFNYLGSKRAGDQQPVEVTVQNNGDEYYGRLYLFASKNSSSKGSYQSRIGVTILENKNITTELSFTPTTEGTYNIWITTDASGNKVIGQSSVQIGALAETPNLSHISTSLNKMVNGNIHGHAFTGVASFQNNGTETFVGSIRVRLLVNTTGSTFTTVNYAYVPVEIASGETKAINYEFSGLTTGKRYLIIYYYPDGTELHQYNSFLCVAAPEAYYADGTVEVLELNTSYVLDEEICAFNLTGVADVTSVTGGNDNTLFIFGSDDNVPTLLDGRNIVKDGEADNITLTDGCDFYSPVNFTAKDIAYTRTFDTGLTRDYRNWTTIVLPFNVSQVTVDLTGQGAAYAAYSAYPIDWFKSSEDTKKNFWVMEFGSEENAIVNFSHAVEIKASRPFLIAVPGVEWGSKNDLTGLPITFRGVDAKVSGDFRAATSGDNYKMKGVVSQKNMSNIYVLNDDGDHFSRESAATVDAFRAYFEPTSTAANAPRLMMAFGNGEVTALEGIFTEEGATATGDGSIYDLQGRKMNREALPKGIYIVNGKKMIVK